ncbi:hypothetical protein M3S_J81, partial [Sorghum bicolor]
VQEHFTSMLSRPPERATDLNWDALNLQHVDLSILDTPFNELEVLNAIKHMPKDKAPGPDGFPMAFYLACWDLVKHELMSVIQNFYDLRSNNLALLNTANIILVPKKEGAERIGDYRPISLIHSIAKIITKILALRLQPYMNRLVSSNQSAFIKTRAIHDNFMYVRNLARRLHRSNTPALLFKLDITKAFDSVRWDYLLDLLQRRGFPTRWRNWLAAIWSSSTSKVLLNGTPGEAIQHGRGLRQGDPLSPLLFVLAIDPLVNLLECATQEGLLTPLRGHHAQLRVSLYADDAAIFLEPSSQDVINLRSLLELFGATSGLSTNLEKSTVVPI